MKQKILSNKNKKQTKEPIRINKKLNRSDRFVYL